MPPSAAVISSHGYGIKYNNFNGMKPAPLKPLAEVKRSTSDYEFLKFLSGGDSGVVYLARDLLLGKEVALKIMSKASVSATRASKIQGLQTSIEAEGKSFLLPVLASWHDTDNYYIVTEYASGGDLAHEIIRCGSFDESRARFYAVEVIAAIEELRRSRIVHRDIKPANILMDRGGHIRLTGFGCAKKFQAEKGFEDLDSPNISFSFEVDGSCESGAFFQDVPSPKFKTSELCGTPHFMSPERIRGREYDVDEDLWSLGVVLYLMLTGRLPFGDDHQDFKSIRHSVLSDSLQFERNDFLSDNAKSLLYAMLAKDLRTRLSLEQIKSHQFFKKIDWDRVTKLEYRAPWIPFLAPPPQGPMSNPPKNIGTAYRDGKDPMPSFTYTSPKLDIPRPEPELEPKAMQKVKRSSIKVFGLSMVKLVKPKKKAELLPTPQLPKAASPVIELTIAPPGDPVNNWANESEVIDLAEDFTQEEEYVDEQEQEFDSITDDIDRLLREIQAPQLPFYQPQPPLEEVDSWFGLNSQVPRLYDTAARCEVNIQEAPELCSAEVETWEETEVQCLDQKKSHLSVIPEGDEEEKERGEGAKQPEGSSTSPTLASSYSPTPTAYLPTPLSSPTATLVPELPSRSASPSVENPGASGTGLLVPSLTVIKKEKHDEQRVLDSVVLACNGAKVPLSHGTGGEMQEARKEKRQSGFAVALDHFRDHLGKLFPSQEGCRRAL